jgi:hypothetical protein
LAVPVEDVFLVLSDKPGCYLFEVDHSSAVEEHFGYEKVIVIVLLQAAGGGFRGGDENEVSGDVGHAEEGFKEGLVVDMVGCS